MFEIKFNGETIKVEDCSTVGAVLRKAGFEPEGVISVVNGEVVPGETLLKDGDALDVLRLAGGG